MSAGPNPGQRGSPGAEGRWLQTTSLYMRKVSFAGLGKRFSTSRTCYPSMKMGAQLPSTHIKSLAEFNLNPRALKRGTRDAQGKQAR